MKIDRLHKSRRPLHGRIFDKFGVEEESSTVLNSFSPKFWGIEDD